MEHSAIILDVQKSHYLYSTSECVISIANTSYPNIARLLYRTVSFSLYTLQQLQLLYLASNNAACNLEVTAYVCAGQICMYFHQVRTYSMNVIL